MGLGVNSRVNLAQPVNLQWWVTSTNVKPTELMTSRPLGTFSVPIIQLTIIHVQAERLGNSFKELLDKHGDGEIPTEEMVEKLMKNTIKDEESLLPHMYSPEREHQLSSIFVDTYTRLVNYKPQLLHFSPALLSF